MPGSQPVRPLVILLLALLSISPAYASETLWDLYLLAKSNDPAIGRSEARLAATRADSWIAISGLIPRLDASAGINQIDHTLINYGPKTLNSSFFAHNYSFTVRFPLLHAPTYFNLAANFAGERRDEAGISNARQKLIVKLVDAYFGLLKAQQDKLIAQEEIERLKKVLEQSQAFLKAGTGDVIAVYEAQARLDSVVADLTRTEGLLRIAELKLSAIVGRPVGAIADYLLERPRRPDPDDLDWWLTTMDNQEPQIIQAREGMSQANLQLKAAKAEFLPVIQASGGYNDSVGSAFLPEVETRQWFVGATVSLPIFSGGETAAKIRRATAVGSERRYMLEELREQLRDTLKQAFFNLRYNAGLITALEQKKRSAELQLTAVRKGRSIGTRSATDLINAEQAYSVAVRDLKNALYDNISRFIQLKGTAGILADEDLAEFRVILSPATPDKATPPTSGN